MGIEDSEKLFTIDALQKIVKAALPHRSQFIDANEPETYYYLLDEIELYLLAELQKILEGREADQAAATRAREIMDAVKQANAEQAQQGVGGI